MLTPRRSRHALGASGAVLLVLALIVGLLVAGGRAAHASSGPVNCPPTDWNPITNTCTVQASGGASAPPSPSGGGHSGGKSGPAPACHSSWGAVPCYVAGQGNWDQTMLCYVELTQPQPPAGAAVWTTHAPGDGAIWTLTCQAPADGPGPYTDPVQVWFAAPPVGQSPAALLAQAEAKLVLDAPKISTAPKSGGMTLVGLPVWLWTSRTAYTWGPQDATAAAGGMTVTASAQVSQIVWTMGDGDTVTCTTPGLAYAAADGANPSPQCGYQYQTSGTYPVRATSTWVISWTAAVLGVQVAQGTLTAPPVYSATVIRVGELQVLTNN